MSNQAVEAMAALVLENSHLRARVAVLETDLEIAMTLGRVFEKGMKVYRAHVLKDRHKFAVDFSRAVAALDRATADHTGITR